MTPAATTAACVIAVGGVDPAGGAGLVRDCATAEALGAAPLLVGTAWTQQSRRGVRGFEARPPEALRGALAWALGEAPRGQTAVKVGMAATPALVEVIVAALEGFDGPVVFDPVLAASSGDSLFAGEPRQVMPLLARATVVTPNHGEAALLADVPPTGTVDGARAAAEGLRALGARAVLVKGGHLPGEPIDLLVWEGRERLYKAPRLPGRTPRGTGCALATAIAVGLARGVRLPEAVAQAKDWLWERIRDAHPVGSERHLR